MNGEVFEIVKIEGGLVALDEDGWEIFPDENSEVSLLFSDIIRGSPGFCQYAPRWRSHALCGRV